MSASSPEANTRLAGIDARLYLVTDSAQCREAGRSVADTVREAVGGEWGSCKSATRTSTTMRSTR